MRVSCRCGFGGRAGEVSWPHSSRGFPLLTGSVAHSCFCAQEGLQQIPSFWKGVPPRLLQYQYTSPLSSCKQPLGPFPCLQGMDIENVLPQVTGLCLGRLKLKLWLQAPSPEKSSFSALSLPVCQNSLHQLKKSRNLERAGSRKLRVLCNICFKEK